MKVKELIEKLSQLDQEKEIKMTIASGWECEETADEGIEISEYALRADTVSNNDDNEDFYLIW